jgi:ATP-dependent RNA helicase DeaD
MHVLEPRQRLDAVINLLLASPEAQTLIFARTRADVGDVAERLSENGFAVTALSGEMDQRERDRALTSFRRADHRVLVATDVAARGIDVQDITLVIHLDPPTDADSYTHRSGRTGRAGRKGRSVLLVAPSAVGKTTMLLKRVKVVARTEPVPSAEQIRATSDQKFLEVLTRDDDGEGVVSDRQKALAEQLAARDDSARTISRLLAMARFAGPTEPREIRRIDRGPDRKLSPRDREPRDSSPRDREPRASSPRDREPRDREPRASSPRDREPRAPYRGAQRDGGEWVSFRITWGGDHGADARKLLAMACRWGEIRGSDVGAIEIERDYSRLSVKASVARGFAEATSKPDSRNPRVTIQADDHGIAPHTMPPPAARASHTPAREAHAPRAPNAPAREAHAPRAPHAPREAHAPAREAHAPAREAHAPRERPAPREAVPPPGPRSGFGLPRNPSRPRVVTGYPRDAKKKQHSAARPHSSPRDAARPHAAARPADAAPPRDGGEPPRRRRVVTR